MGSDNKFIEKQLETCSEKDARDWIESITNLISSFTATLSNKGTDEEKISEKVEPKTEHDSLVDPEIQVEQHTDASSPMQLKEDAVDEKPQENRCDDLPETSVKKDAVEKKEVPPSPLPPFNVGDKVMATWGGDDKWFPGTITEVTEDGLCSILYNDGDAEKRKDPIYIRARQVQAEPPRTSSTDQVFKIGDKVEAAWQGGEKWFWGTVTEVTESGLYNIRYDDGDTETGKEAKFIRSGQVMPLSNASATINEVDFLSKLDGRVPVVEGKVEESVESASKPFSDPPPSDTDSRTEPLPPRLKIDLQVITSGEGGQSISPPASTSPKQIPRNTPVVSFPSPRRQASEEETTICQVEADLKSSSFVPLAYCDAQVVLENHVFISDSEFEEPLILQRGEKQIRTAIFHDCPV